MTQTDYDECSFDRMSVETFDTASMMSLDSGMREIDIDACNDKKSRKENLMKKLVKKSSGGKEGYGGVYEAVRSDKKNSGKGKGYDSKTVKWIEKNIEPIDETERTIYNSKGRQSSSCRISLYLLFGPLLFAGLAGLNIYLSNERHVSPPIFEPKEEETEPSNPLIVSQSFIQHYKGESIEHMNFVQIEEFENTMESYSLFYGKSGGIDSPGEVTTECSLKVQTLYSGKYRKHSEYGTRELQQSRETYLEVGFDMIYASSSNAVISAEKYPGDFLKFMNTNVGKEYIVKDLRSIGIAVDNVDDISGLEMNSVTSTKVTESPTPVPTLSHSIAPSSSSVAPSSSPDTTPSSAPASFPSLSPSTYPTRVPTRKPSPRPSKKPTDRPTRHPTRQPTRCKGFIEQIIWDVHDILFGQW